MKIKFIGTSSGESLPREDNCPQCVSKDKKDNRLRSAILVNKFILIDAGPDISNQITKQQIKTLEAVLVTHEHNDHVGGLKDLMKIRPGIRIIKLIPGQHFKLLGIDFHAFKVKHSNLIPTVAIEIDNIIYAPCYSDLDQARQYLKNTKIAILDGSSLNRSFGGHLSINESIAFTKPMKNLKSIYFTHNGHTHKTHREMQKIVKSLGDNRYNIAHDGLEIEI